MKSFEESLSTYLDAAEWWLSDEESPIVATLEHLAQALDTKMNASLVSQYRLLLKELDLRKPEAPKTEGDDLDDLIPSE